MSSGLLQTAEMLNLSQLCLDLLYAFYQRLNYTLQLLGLQRLKADGECAFRWLNSTWSSTVAQDTIMVNLSSPLKWLHSLLPRLPGSSLFLTLQKLIERIERKVTVPK